MNLDMKTKIIMLASISCWINYFLPESTFSVCFRSECKANCFPSLMYHIGIPISKVPGFYVRERLDFQAKVFLHKLSIQVFTVSH